MMMISEEIMQVEVGEDSSRVRTWRACGEEAASARWIRMSRRFHSEKTTLIREMLMLQCVVFKFLISKWCTFKNNHNAYLFLMLEYWTPAVGSVSVGRSQLTCRRTASRNRFGHSESSVWWQPNSYRSCFLLLIFADFFVFISCSAWGWVWHSLCMYI